MLITFFLLFLVYFLFKISLFLLQISNSRLILIFFFFFNPSFRPIDAFFGAPLDLFVGALLNLLICEFWKWFLLFFLCFLLPEVQGSDFGAINFSKSFEHFVLHVKWHIVQCSLESLEGFWKYLNSEEVFCEGFDMETEADDYLDWMQWDELAVPEAVLVNHVDLLGLLQHKKKLHEGGNFWWVIYPINNP